MDTMVRNQLLGYHDTQTHFIKRTNKWLIYFQLFSYGFQGESSQYTQYMFVHLSAFWVVCIWPRCMWKCVIQLKPLKDARQVPWCSVTIIPSKMKRRFHVHLKSCSKRCKIRRGIDWDGNNKVVICYMCQLEMFWTTTTISPCSLVGFGWTKDSYVDFVPQAGLRPWQGPLLVIS
jgi:hypothetical protein